MRCVESPQSAHPPAQGSLSLAQSLFFPATDKSDMVGRLLHLSGCAIVDPFVSSRN